MLKKTITFLDLDENEVQEDFYFHMGKAELIEWELSEEGGYSAHLQRALEASKRGDSREIANLLRTLITKTIGIKGADNREFDRQKGAVAERFLQLDAYNVLFEELGETENAAADFLEAVVPAKVRAAAAEEVARRKAAGEGNQAEGAPAVPQPAVQAAPAEVPAWIKEDRDPTTAEFGKMTPTQMQQAFAAKEKRLARDKAPGDVVEGSAAQ